VIFKINGKESQIMAQILNTEMITLKI